MGFVFANYTVNGREVVKHGLFVKFWDEFGSILKNIFLGIERPLTPSSAANQS